MKLPELKSRYQKLHLTLRTVFSLPGLLIAAVVFAIVVGVSINGLFNTGASRAFAAPHVYQEELKIQLGAGGFTPAEVQRAAGTFAIAVENSIMSGEYTLRLKAADGTVLKEVQVQKGSAAWTMTLSAGEYTLTEASHPQWLCRITVQ